MNLWARLVTLIRIKLRKLGQQNEDPMAILERLIGDMDQNLQKLGRQVLELGRTKGRLQTEVAKLDGFIHRYETQAREALKLSDEATAREALLAKQKAKSAKENLDGELTKLGNWMAALERSKAGLKNRIQIYKTKRDELKLLKEAASVELDVRQVSAGISTDDVLQDIKATIERGEQEIKEIQAKVEATRELEEETLAPGLEGREALEGDEEVEELPGISEDLERLKQEIKGEKKLD